MGDLLEGKSHEFWRNTYLQACLFSASVRLFCTVTHRHMVQAVAPCAQWIGVAISIPLYLGLHSQNWGCISWKQPQA